METETVPAVWRSPERITRTVAVGVTGLAAFVSPVSTLTRAVIIAVALLVAWRFWGVRLELTEAGLADHRTLRTVHRPWSTIQDIGTARGSGLTRGFCLVAVDTAGRRHDLVATRVYTVTASKAHHDDLMERCERLQAVLRARQPMT